MKKQIDQILLGLLWFLASILGASFWFNTKFAFNIFSSQHWQFLGQLQASRAPVTPSFYISMIIMAAIMIGGLYIIVRPKFRKIKLATPPAKQDIAKPAPTTEPPIIVTPAEKPVDTMSNANRPPRLSLSQMNSNNAVPPPPVGTPQTFITPNPVVPVAQPQIQQPSVPVSDFKDIEDVFSSAGFLVKKPPKIGNLRPALFAIGPDETVWLGAVGVEPAKLTDVIDKLQMIFIETLEDIQININAFIIATKPGNTPELTVPVDIHHFATVNELRDYMSNRKSRAVAEDEEDDFKAYSDYIDTVADYFNKG